jgi:response regulator RpfG family c-di-GMP phosphodiesterase
MSNTNHIDKQKTDQYNFNKSKKYKLLLIDDEESSLTAIELSLFGSEYEVIKAYNGTEGIQYIKDNPNTVDIILLDLMMPDITGTEVIKELKKIDCKIPIIVQTASCTYSDISKTLSLGAKNFLSKPFDKKLLLSVLNKAFSDENTVAPEGLLEQV